jgi:hypothetical protein
MNLLLLLSALLSALTGVGQGVRGGRAPETVCASAAAVAPATTRTALVAARPVQGWPRLADAPRLVLTALRLRPAEPVFAGRRRE